MSRLKFDPETLQVVTFPLTEPGPPSSPLASLNSHYDCSGACFVATNVHSGC